MPALPTQRASLCLFCAFAAARAPLRLLPRVQRAHRSGGHTKRVRTGIPRFAEGRASNARLGLVGRAEFNPLNFDAGAGQFFEVVRRKLAQLKAEIETPEFLQSLQLTRETLDTEWLTFERSISLWIRRGSPEVDALRSETLRGKKSLEARLRYLFYAQVCGGRFTQAELENQKEVADLRYPAEWYPATREMARTVHLHVGPTNSGKTYHALKRLEEAEKGIYLGPLRLLAHEVYTRLNAKGKPCALITGEEQRMPEQDPKMWSCTVEMAPLNQPLEVAVIDEIQMINHKDRGWAWTQAFLGIQAKEIHLCGEARTVPLMRELCALVGDKVHVHEYERLTPLKVADRSLQGNLHRLEKGDCVVAFSILGIHALRREIERKTGKKCAIVYGSLPPETRAQQARLFNDPNNDYDYLVASDAIGMGLNLAIKRVIFESTMKSNGTRLVPLQISEIKQIAGRAGRYKTAHEATTEDESQAADSGASSDPTIGLDDVTPTSKVLEKSKSQTVGYATTLEQLDYGYLKIGMTREAEPIKTAGLFPPSVIVERFASYFPPGTPFSYIQLRLHEISNIHPRFHLCALRDQLAIADVIHTVKNLSITDRIIICAAPTNMKDEGERKFLRAMAESIADQKSGDLLDLPNLPLEILDEQPSHERLYLYKLEQLHKMLVAYLWLSYRFPHVFTTRGLANHTKKLVEAAIERTLMEFSYTEHAKQVMQKKRQQAMRELEAMEKAATAAQRATPAHIPGAPQEVDDILNDSQSFDSEEAPTDDEGEFPIEETDVLGTSMTQKLHVMAKRHHQRTQELSHQAKNMLNSQVPSTSSAQDASQPSV